MMCVKSCQFPSCCADSIIFIDEWIFDVTISSRKDDGHLSFDIHNKTPVDLYKRIYSGYFIICY